MLALQLHAPLAAAPCHTARHVAPLGGSSYAPALSSLKLNRTILLLPREKTGTRITGAATAAPAYSIYVTQSKKPIAPATSYSSRFLVPPADNYPNYQPRGSHNRGMASPLCRIFRALMGARVTRALTRPLRPSMALSGLPPLCR